MRESYLGLTRVNKPSSTLPKRLVFQRKSLVGDFRKRTLSDATQPNKLLQLLIIVNSCVLLIEEFAPNLVVNYITHSFY